MAGSGLGLVDLFEGRVLTRVRVMAGVSVRVEVRVRVMAWVSVSAPL